MAARRRRESGGRAIDAWLGGHPAGAGLGRMRSRVVTAPFAVVIAPPLIAAGVALLAWDYVRLPAPPANDVLYWLALGLVLAGVWLAGAAGRPSTARQLVALAALGAATWLPYYLRSPGRLIFNDERYHLDVLDRMLASGSSSMDPRLYALPGSFPGLENNALAMIAWTGLPAEPAIRLLTLSIHAAIPVVVYLFGRAIGLGRWAAFAAAVVYAANTSFVFFHSLFSYESLGILLYLATWVVVALGLRHIAAGGSSRPSRTLVLAALPLVAGIVVTHHVSSYLLAASLGLAAVVLRRGRAAGAGAVAVLAAVTAVAATTWFLSDAGRLIPYLAGTLSQRIDAIAEMLLGDHAQPRTLFQNSEIPIGERLVAYAYPLLVLLLGLGGLAVRRRRRRRDSSPGRWRRRGWWPGGPRQGDGPSEGPSDGRGSGGRESGSVAALWPVLALVGPLGWLLTTPAVLTRSGELAYRSWPFLFLGVAPYAAVALAELRRRVAGRARGLGGVAAFAITGLLLMGGFSIGDNQAGRFPTASPRTAAGPANATADAVAAATWLRSTVGEDHVVATDSGNAVTFSTEGGQRILRWNSWYPFVVDDPAQIVPFMVGTKTEFLVVDRQLTTLPPRYGGYFGPPAIPADRDPGQPIPAGLLDRLDGVSGLQRIYDNGRIRIYALPGDRGSGP